MKILVTGGAGYIGTATVKKLIENKHEVFVIDNLSRGQKEKLDSKAVLFQIDLTAKKEVEKVLLETKPDAVIHLSAFKSVEESEKHPEMYIQNNLGGTVSLLTAMAGAGVSSLVFSSSASVYSPKENDNQLYKETDPLGSLSTYGRVKELEEKVIELAVEKGVISSATSLRYFNVAGDAGLCFKEKNPENVFPILAKAFREEGEFNIFGTDYPTRDKTAIRDYIHLNDIVDAHIKALDVKPGYHVFNLGTSKGVSVKELVEAFKLVSDKSAKIKNAPRRAGDPAVVIADSTLAKEKLNWEPKYTLEEMVKSTWEVYGK